MWSQLSLQSSEWVSCIIDRGRNTNVYTQRALNQTLCTKSFTFFFSPTVLLVSFFSLLYWSTWNRTETRISIIFKVSIRNWKVEKEQCMQDDIRPHQLLADLLGTHNNATNVYVHANTLTLTLPPAMTPTVALTLILTLTLMLILGANVNMSTFYCRSGDPSQKHSDVAHVTSSILLRLLLGSNAHNFDKMKWPAHKFWRLQDLKMNKLNTVVH